MPVALPLIGLAELLLLVVALALCIGVQKFTEAILGAMLLVTHVPLLGRLLGTPFRKAERFVNSKMTELVAGLETAVAESWHVLAELMAGAAHLLVEMSEATAHVWDYVYVRFPLHVISATVDALVAGAHAAKKIARTPPAKTVTVVVGGLAAFKLWTQHRIHRLEAAIAHVAPHAPVKIGRLERDVARLKTRLRKQEKALGGLAFAGLVWTALHRLGLDWIKCPPLGRAMRGNCSRVGRFLETILGATIDVLLVTHICEVARLVGLATEAVKRPIQELTGAVGGSLCGGAHEPPPNLPVQMAALPPAVNPLTL